MAWWALTEWAPDPQLVGRDEPTSWTPDIGMYDVVDGFEALDFRGSGQGDGPGWCLVRTRVRGRGGVNLGDDPHVPLPRTVTDTVSARLGVPIPAGSSVARIARLMLVDRADDTSADRPNRLTPTGDRTTIRLGGDVLYATERATRVRSLREQIDPLANIRMLLSSDDFNRTEDPLSTNWEKKWDHPDARFRANGNRCVGDGGTTGKRGYQFTVDCGGDDMYAKIDLISGETATGALAGVISRMQTDGAGYTAMYYQGGGGTSFFYIRRIDSAGNTTNLASSAQTLEPGTFESRCVGSTISSIKTVGGSETENLSTTDTTHTAGQRGGLWSTRDALVWDNYEQDRLDLTPTDAEATRTVANASPLADAALLLTAPASILVVNATPTADAAMLLGATATRLALNATLLEATATAAITATPATILAAATLTADAALALTATADITVAAATVNVDPQLLLDSTAARLLTNVTLLADASLLLDTTADRVLLIATTPDPNIKIGVLVAVTVLRDATLTDPTSSGALTSPIESGVLT